MADDELIADFFARTLTPHMLFLIREGEIPYETVNVLQNAVTQAENGNPQPLTMFIIDIMRMYSPISSGFNLGDIPSFGGGIPLENFMYKDDFDINKVQPQYRANLEKRNRYRRNGRVPPPLVLQEAEYEPYQLDSPPYRGSPPASPRERVSARVSKSESFRSKPPPSSAPVGVRAPKPFESKTVVATEEEVSKPKAKKQAPAPEPAVAAAAAAAPRRRNEASLPPIRFATTLIKFEKEKIDEFGLKKASKKMMKDSEYVARVLQAEDPYDLILLEPDSGTTVPIFDTRTFSRYVYPSYVDWDEEDPIEMSPTRVFDDIKKNPDYKDAAFNLFLKAVYQNYVKPPSAPASTEQKDLVKQYAELLKLKGRKHSGYTKFKIEDLQRLIKELLKFPDKKQGKGIFGINRAPFREETIKEEKMKPDRRVLPRELGMEGLGRGDDRFQPFNHGMVGRALL